ncbi:MAG TPA: YihY/virulence factor BrkB family protein [Candidatus Kapabacteria bacterium]|jgi:membrane protein|nr:YihY/virulence factor BrkB family protein [Candidatus Kapabacteria bacterium]
MILRTGWEVVSETFSKWIDDKAPRLAAALSYYTIFAIAPTLVIVIGVASMVFGQEAAQGKIVTEIEGLVGRDGAEAVQTILKSSAQDDSGVLATVLGFVALIIGATTVFIELQDSLNTIWGVQPKPGRGIMGMLRDRVMSFAMVVGTGFVLMVSLVVSAALSALETWMVRVMPEMSIIIIQIVQTIVSLVIFTLLIGAIYRVLPDAKISWRDVGIGAFITAALFTLGKFLIGLYLGQGSVASTYGAAGSLAVLFVWVYYSGLIFFLGAEFTKVYANRWGGRVEPTSNAILLGTKVCVQPDGSPAEDIDAMAEKRSERISQ